MKIAVITKQESDFSELLKQYGDVTILEPHDAEHMEGYDAYAVLGGCEKEALRIPIDTRLILEQAREDGKKVFIEWCQSIGYVFADQMTESVSGRMVYVGEEKGVLGKGALLDDRANTILHCYGLGSASSAAKPILVFGGHMTKHDRLEEVPSYRGYDYTLWQNDEHTMICSFRFCNFVTARFAPKERWDAVAAQIISFLTGKDVTVSTQPKVSMDHAPQSCEETFHTGLQWFEQAGILLDDGKSGVREGLMHNISPDGVQPFYPKVRNDCSGEVGGAYFFDWYLHKNQTAYVRFHNLQEFCFEKMYETKGLHRGMMRWSTAEWGVCYQDDVARTMLGTLLSMQLTEDRTYLDKICTALDYLLLTTGTDGLRISRTDAVHLSAEQMQALREKPSDFPCAHHNGYYMAVLLMAYQLTGEKRYLETAQKGIETLMSVFPNTIREHSETQELCRLILPLACLYEVTKQEKHKAWLYLVVEMLETHRFAGGGYMEYDTGYQAKRSRTSGTESSLLADNGDCVADLLYSVNWLPLAFAYSYRVTKDEKFLTLWQEVVTFLSEIQTNSSDLTLHGSWCRGIDLERREAYGMPHDVGWGPCAVESGWTVGEILMGIGFGMAYGMDRPTKR